MKLSIPRCWAIFAATCTLFLLSQFYKTCLAVITPQLMADLSLDAKGISLMSAAFFYAFALAQLPMGIYLDRIGPRVTMTVLSLIAVTGGFIFAWSDSLAVSVVGRALLGIGMACNLMGSFKLITLWFDPLKFATLSAMIASLGTLGNITSTTPLVLLVKGIGWRDVFTLFAVITFMAATVFFLVVRDKPHETPFGAKSRPASKGFKNMFSDLRPLFKTRDYWIISFANFGRFGIYFALQSLWAGPYLMEAMGSSPIRTGNIILALNIGFAFGGPLFGFLSDSILKTRKWIVIFGLACFCLIFLTVALLPPGTSTLILTLLFFGIGFFNSTGLVMYAQMKEQVPSEMAGTAMASINFFALVGAAAFLHVLGNLMQNLFPDASFGLGAFRVTFLVCASYLAVATFTYCLTRDTKSGLS
jgi:MFS family permease